ncbi:phosphoesterase [Candidatus Woesearchaeota archaeon CG08_land_8_20_14_0_20_47_9]|nr:MAG: phosphoesterase [Candidatus Woesearchaeota archaeon CG08_land_8_20_14_0_20_47_9]
MQQIYPHVRILGLALVVDYQKTNKALILADLHIGYEEALNKQGVLVPRFQFRVMEGVLKRLLKNRRFDSVVINGDLKHEFGSISDQEWRETLSILDTLAGHSDQIVLVKGNHDTLLGPIANKKRVMVKDFLMLDKMLIVHGHRLPGDIGCKAFVPKAEAIIIAHEHPAIKIRAGSRQERYKCFLKGSWDAKPLIVMPSFNPLYEGSDILAESLLSPYLSASTIPGFEVYVVPDDSMEALYFGRVKDLLREN